MVIYYQKPIETTILLSQAEKKKSESKNWRWGIGKEKLTSCTLSPVLTPATNFTNTELSTQTYHNIYAVGNCLQWAIFSLHLAKSFIISNIWISPYKVLLQLSSINRNWRLFSALSLYYSILIFSLLLLGYMSTLSAGSRHSSSLISNTEQKAWYIRPSAK